MQQHFRKARTDSQILIYLSIVLFGASCTISPPFTWGSTKQHPRNLGKNSQSSPINIHRSSLKRSIKTKDLDALKEVYNIRFDERNEPNIHASLASKNTILLKIQQHEFINSAQTESDFVEEKFSVDITAKNIKVVTPNGNIIQPLSIHRKSKISASLKQANRFILDHFFYLNLPQDLNIDSSYKIQFTGTEFKKIIFIPKNSVSLSIHHARAYDVNNPVKRAKLSTWTGSAGLDYPSNIIFRIRDEIEGTVVHTGIATLTSPDDAAAGTDIFNLDFSPIRQSGTYRIEVDEIGRSLPFEIREGVWEDLVDLMLKGLYTHRAFYPIESEYSSFTRPGNSDITFYKSSFSEVDFKFMNVGKVFQLLPTSADRKTPYKLRGGWFDAGDYDTKVEHLSVITSLVDLYHSNPRFFKQFNSKIPESNDSIPDILNEALWGMKLYEQLQTPEGGVSGGFEFDSHPQGVASWEETEAFIYAPDFYASYHFAIAATKLSIALEKFDAIKSATLKQRALKAMSWAEREYSQFQLPQKSKGFRLTEKVRQICAIKLYQLTKEKKYHDIFISIKNKRNYKAGFTYAQLNQEEYIEIDPKWQDILKSKLIEHGDKLVKFGLQNGFDTLNNPEKPQKWGFNTVLTTDQAHHLAMAHQLTKDRKYLDTLAASMQFGLGMNPDNMALTTGTVRRKLAYDEPDNVLHADGMRLDSIPDGITIYGFFGHPWFAWSTVNTATQNIVFDTRTQKLAVPLLESFNDYHNLVPMTEYTIHQTIEDQIFAFGYLAGQTEKTPKSDSNFQNNFSDSDQ